MFRSHTRMLVASLVSAFSLAPISASFAGSQIAANCQSGVTDGTFAVPDFTGGNGFISGDLYQGDFLIFRYHLEGTLEEIASPCLSCIQGLIQATLDDGVGPGPDYVVRGWYLGAFFTGEGEFYTRVFKPSGGPAVGTIRGTFADHPVDTALGTYLGGWRICN